MLICITGKSGSGKSYISNLITKNNDMAYLSIDEVGHDSLLNIEVQKALLETFGQELFRDAEVDRRKLSELVFNSRDNMKKLTDITWKYMEQYIDMFIENNKEKTIVLDWILLPQTKYFKMSNIKVLVDVPYEIRLERAMTRDNITQEAFEKREKASIEYDKDKFDYIIDNTDFSKTEERVKKIYDKSIVSR